MQQSSLSQQEKTGHPELPGAGLDMELGGNESIKVKSLTYSARPWPGGPLVACSAQQHGLPIDGDKVVVFVAFQDDARHVLPRRELLGGQAQHGRLLGYRQWRGWSFATLALNATEIAQAGDGIISDDSAGKQYDPTQPCSEHPQQAGGIQMQTFIKCYLLGTAHDEADQPGPDENPEAER